MIDNRDRQSNIFLIELTFKWAKISLYKLSLRSDFKTLLTIHFSGLTHISQKQM